MGKKRGTVPLLKRDCPPFFAFLLFTYREMDQRIPHKYCIVRKFPAID
jgi:hypothetical protein